MNTRTICFAVALLGLASCATDFTKQVTEARLKYVQNDLGASHYYEAFLDAKPLIAGGEPGRTQVLSLLKGSPAFNAGFHQQLNERIAASNPEALEDDISIAETVGIMTPAERTSAHNNIGLALHAVVISGERKLTFGPVTNVYPTILDEAGFAKILSNTIDQLTSTPPTARGERRSTVTALFAQMKSNPEASKHKARLETALSQMSFTADELREDVSTVFQTYAQKALVDRVKTVALVVNPPRRALELDLGDRISKDTEVSLVSESNKAKYIVSVEELDYREQQDAPRTRTATVGYLQADPLYAVLAMPKNASFLFDVIEQDQRIEWRYEIRIRGLKGERSKVLKDTETSSAHQCVNARIVNVFGGVSAPSGWPNAQTASYCTGNANLTSLHDVREKVLDRVSQEITALLSTPE